MRSIIYLVGMPVVYLLSFVLMLTSAALSALDGCVAVIFHAFHRFEFWSGNIPMLSVICDPRLKTYSQIFKEAYTGEIQSYLELYAKEEKRQEDAYHAKKAILNK